MSDKKLKEKQAKLISQLADICEALNWCIVIPHEEMTSGLIIGNKAYIEHAAKKVYGKAYEVINPKIENKKEPLTVQEELQAQVVELSEEEYAEFMETGELPDSVVLPEKPVYH